MEHDPPTNDNGTAASRPKLSELLDKYTHKTTLSIHHAAATLKNRQEEGRAAPGFNSNCSEYWTLEDTNRALADCEFEQHLGLKFYHEDPLPKIMEACHVHNSHGQKTKTRFFVDHEFPTHCFTTVKLPSHRVSSKGITSRIRGHDRHNADTGGAFELTVVEPGIITDSNCQDFNLAGGKRASRVHVYAERAKASRKKDGTHERGGWHWVRGSSMSNHRLFSSPQNDNSKTSGSDCDSVHPRNIIQGRIGNCGFCSGFASIAACDPSIFRDAFGKLSPDCLTSCGAVSLRLYPNGRPRYILLDDYILCCKMNDTTSSSSKNHHHHHLGSPSIHSLIEEDLWIRLVEKAFAKIQGSYASLDGYYKYNSLYRHPARAMQLLTGAALALEIWYGQQQQQNQNDRVSNSEGTNQVFNSNNVTSNIVFNLLVQTQGNYARVAHCRSTTMGLRSNHGYSLLWIGSVAQGVKLVCLRNPHGKGSFHGPYGYGLDAWKGRGEILDCLQGMDVFEKCHANGKVRWQGDDRDRLHKKTEQQHNTASGLEDHDEGIFFMEFSEFMKCFPAVTIVGPLLGDQSRYDAPLPSNHVLRINHENMFHVKQILDVVTASTNC